MKQLIIANVFMISTLACGTAPAPQTESAESIQKVNIFEAQTGGYAHYRVPAIAVSTQGTLLAFAEARKNQGGDWGPIDIVMRRSKDGGKSWEEPRVIAHVAGEIQQNPVALAQGLAKPGEVTYNNIVPIVDKQNGKLHFLFCVEYARAYSMSSADDGETFSEPVDITSTFEDFRKDYDWKVIATGPGHGIQLANGRLLAPVWLSDGTGGHAHRPSIVAVIFSDDHGKTWQRGDVVVRHPDLKNPSETIAVELSDGRVMLNIRSESPEHRRAVAYSQDGATAWSTPVFDDELIEPICMGSILRLSQPGENGKAHILFVNPNSTEPRSADNLEGRWVRQNVTARLSADDGENWPIARALEPGVSGYSDLAQGPDGSIYCIYENGSPSGSGTHVKFLTVARFGLDWLTANQTAND